MHRLMTTNLTTEEDIDAMKHAMKAPASQLVLKRVRELLESKERSVLDKIVSSDFTSPSWSEQQAHLTGELRTLRELQQIIRD